MSYLSVGLKGLQASFKYLRSICLLDFELHERRNPIGFAVSYKALTPPYNHDFLTPIEAGVGFSVVPTLLSLSEYS